VLKAKRVDLSIDLFGKKSDLVADLPATQI
jgi:hypothetical protein